MIKLERVKGLEIVYSDKKEFTINDLQELLKKIKEKYKAYLYIILIAENNQLIKFYSQNGFTYMDGRYVFTIQNG